MVMFLWRNIESRQSQAARHAQMHYYGASFYAKQQIFSPPAHSSNFLARQLCFETRIHRPTQPTITDHNTLDPMTD
jgi:hypothetical protein